ncbi:DUF4214 domain-containing protein [Halochromatium roseum]|uniref:DUF4214 domain-containing protein n=1 Tax=Halochromatium roseum TaxID=391920 RepID=UPI001911FC91|nr:DUF4214 domain-containing protein [Halochromatium roseum]MBK5938908.1 hypothetical protein [Halochromatium roseum]
MAVHTDLKPVALIWMLPAILLSFMPAAGSAALCTTRDFSAAEQRVTEAYVAYYGRPADAAGLAYWADRLEADGGDLASIIDAFGVSAEFDDRFGSLDHTQLVTNLYQQLFGRDPDPAGLAFYTGELDAGRMGLQTIALNILDGTQGDDVPVRDHRLQVANYVVSCLEQGHVVYPPIDTAVAIMADVDAESSSVERAVAAVDALAPSTSARLQPEDLVYQGAFRLPDSFDWGARGMGYTPTGDSGSGSLLVTAFQGLVNATGEPCWEGMTGCEARFGEVAIPASERGASASTWETLPVASLLFGPTAFDGGLAGRADDEHYVFVAGIEQIAVPGLSERMLYGSLNQWYPEGVFGDASFPTLWRSDENGANAEGLFHVGPSADPIYHGRKMGEYLFAVPQWYADAALGGRRLITGRARGTPLQADPDTNPAAGGSQGPTLFAFPAEASAPAGAELDALPLLYYRARYPDCAGPDIGVGGQVVSCDFPGYSMSDDWTGAGFVSDGSRHAIVILGLKASTNCYYCDPAEPDPECPVSPAPEECRRWCNESRGYHGGPYRRQVLFYDIDELAAVAAGSREPWSVLPYATWEPHELLLQPVDGNVCAGTGGVAFDTDGQRLFLVERGLGGYDNINAAVVHVWQIP